MHQKTPMRFSRGQVRAFVRRWVKQETQLSLTDRAMRLEILTFEKYRDLGTGVRVPEGH